MKTARPSGREVAVVFFGDHYPRLDDKGRLFLPAKFRERLGDGLVITKGQDRCLSVFPRDEFEEIAARLRRGSMTDRTVRDYERMLFAGADDPMPDRQGRIVIKPELREYAGLTHECAVVGANARVEIWDATAWRRFSSEREQQFVELSGEVVPPPA